MENKIHVWNHQPVYLNPPLVPITIDCLLMVESISCFFFRTWRVPKSAHCATYCHLFEVLEGSIYRIYIYNILYILYIYNRYRIQKGLRVPDPDLHGHLSGPFFLFAPAKRDTLCIHCVAKAVQAPEAKPALKRSTPWQRTWRTVCGGDWSRHGDVFDPKKGRTVEDLDIFYGKLKWFYHQTSGYSLAQVNQFVDLNGV